MSFLRTREFISEYSATLYDYLTQPPIITPPHFFNCFSLYLLCLIDGLRHGEESAVGEDREHDQVVEVLVHRDVDSDTPELEYKYKYSDNPEPEYKYEYSDTSELEYKYEHSDTPELEYKYK